ncbi:MAG: cyclic nucleotide-binding domain-containing protein [Verrucomicrobia bacterium]|jgi:CRP-like cAMP-binding protein|nr:cyclic nucleotide-binding domain-containing protein [Verrucomicrobiota bacterium]
MKTEIQNPASAQGANDLLQIIAAHPFLRGMSAGNLQVLADSAMLKHFDAGELIFREGDVANRFYLIREGKVALETTDENKIPYLVQHIGAGDVLGWSWLFPPYYWNFDARAVEPTEAIFFYGTRLREQSETDPALGYDLMKRISEIIIQRLQTTRKQLLEQFRKERGNVGEVE